MAERRVPRIRFKGFEEDWEQRKLGELVERVTRKNENMESTLALTISAQYGLIDQEEFFDKRIASKNIEGYFLIRKGEFAYNKSTSMDAPWGAVKRLDRYERGVLSTLYILFRILNEQQVDSEYLVSYYCTDLWHTEVQKIAAEGARNHGLLNIAPNDFFEMNLAAPKELQEQTKIGRLFQSLDSLLSLHQRKLEKLKVLKKAMLEKMFPKNGAKVPEIRFSGFTDDWEQRKLGEVFEEYSEKGHEELPPLTIAQGQGTIRRDESERTLQFDRESLSNYKVVHQNDFIVHLRSFEGGLEKANSLGIISPAYHTFHGGDTDSQFYYNYFRSRQFVHKELKPHVYGIRDGRSIDIEGMKTIRIPFTSLKEQSTIGSFILVLDTLLSLHQRKLEKLRQIKTSMLERMFV